MCVTMTQHPVGQGGLFYGTLHHGDGKFKWIYDCGSKDAAARDREIDKISELCNGTINAFYLSHFHYDHMNGINRLVKKNRIKIEDFIVPYLNKFERLATLASHELSEDELEGDIRIFILKPKKFFFALGANRIIMISHRDSDDEDRGTDPASPETGRPIGTEGPEESERDIDDSALKDDGSIQVWTPRWKKKKVGYKGDSSKMVLKASSRAIAEISFFIFPGPRIIHRLVFVTHARSIYGRELSKFRKEINRLKKSFGVKRASDIIKKGGFTAVRDCYRGIWCNGHQNSISMSLYIGPDKSYVYFPYFANISFAMNRVFRYANRSMYCFFQRLLSFLKWDCRAQWKYMSGYSSYGGWLLTGDSVIVNDGRDKRKNFRDQFERRYQDYMPYVNVLMVPHHGSDRNNVSRSFFDLFNNLDVCYVTANPCAKYFNRPHPHEKVVKMIPKPIPFHVVDTHPESILEVIYDFRCWPWYQHRKNIILIKR